MIAGNFFNLYRNSYEKTFLCNLDLSPLAGLAYCSSNFECNIQMEEIEFITSVQPTISTLDSSRMSIKWEGLVCIFAQMMS